VEDYSALLQTCIDPSKNPKNVLLSERVSFKNNA